MAWVTRTRDHKTKHDIVGHANKNKNTGYYTFRSHQQGTFLKTIIPIYREHYQFQHPTQKPVKLFKQLIELTTKERDLVIDPFAGSFTTAIACLELGRNYICIEKDKEYFEIGKNRIAKWHEDNKQKDLFSCEKN